MNFVRLVQNDDDVSVTIQKYGMNCWMKEKRYLQLFQGCIGLNLEHNPASGPQNLGQIPWTMDYCSMYFCFKAPAMIHRRFCGYWTP